MSDAIHTQTIIQPKLDLDPKKLIIYCNGISSHMDENIPVMFSLHNQNLQDVSDFDIDPDYDYPLNKSDIKFDQYVSEHANKLTVGLIGGNFIKRRQGKLRIVMTITSDSEGELFVRSNFANLTDKSEQLETYSKSYKFNTGTTNLDFVLDDIQFHPMNAVCFGASVNCHISNCYVYSDIEIDDFIESKSQDIVLDYYFTEKDQYIKHDGTNWVDSNGTILDDHDQQQLNSLNFDDGKTNIVSIDLYNKTYLRFELASD